MNNHNLPHRFREANFRRFEEVIAKAVASFPEVIEYNPYPLANETFAARLRDAITSLRNNQWNTSRIAMEKFIVCCDELTVSIQPTGVRIGSAELMKKDKEVPTFSTSKKAKEPQGLVLDSLDDEGILSALITLHSKNVLTKPTLFTHPSETTKKILQEACKNYDIAVSGEGDEIILI